MKKVFLIIAAFFVTASTMFAPTPRFFALNHKTKQCAGYWGGDEYVNYKLPPGWVIFKYELQYPKGSIINATFEVKTDNGICHVPWTGQMSSEKSCCSELGYTYVSENIGIRDNAVAQDWSIEMIGIVSILIIIVARLWLFHRKKTIKVLTK